MKKLLVIALSAFCFTAKAQVSIGGKAGVNFSNLTGKSLDDVKKSMKIGYYVGGYVDFWIGENLAIQPEALLSVQGSKLDSFSINLTYINIPVLLKLKTDGGFYFEAGPQFGFNITAKEGDKSVKDFVNGIDLAAAAGLGYQVSGTFGIGARYVVGLSKIGNSKNANPDFKNSNIQLGIFVGLGGPSGKKK
jgi:hypothetical protein